MLERWEISGINRKLQLKPLEFESDIGDVPGLKRASKLLLVLKWGGELTKLGEKQAMTLGHSFRESLYPGVGSEVGGGGLLRLHSTFRHDLKIKTSDEVRKRVSHPPPYLHQRSRFLISFFCFPSADALCNFI